MFRQREYRFAGQRMPLDKDESIVPSHSGRDML